MHQDDGRGREAQDLGAGMALHDGIQWRAHLRIDKRLGEWSEEQIAGGEAIEPYEVFEKEGNLLLTAGVLQIWKALRGDGSLTAFSNANSYVGIGDATTAEAAGQTDLQASANKTRKGMASGYPKVGTAEGLGADNQIQFQAVFGPGDANYHWQEWIVVNGSSGGTALNRKVVDMGVKTSVATWTVTVTLSLA